MASQKVAALIILAMVFIFAASIEVEAYRLNEECYRECFKICMRIRGSTPVVCKDQCEPLCDYLDKIKHLV